MNRKDRTGQQRLRGRLPRARQHRRLRPQRAAARPAATSSRPTARRGWRCSARTCSSIALELAAHDPVYEDLARQVRRALLLRSRPPWTARRARRRAVGRRGRLLLRRAPPARRQRPAAQGPLDGRAAAAVRRDRVSSPTMLERFPGSTRAAARLPRPQPRTSLGQHRRPDGSRASTAGACSRSSTRTSCAGSSRACSTRSEFLSPHGIRSLSRVPRASTRTSSTSTGSDYRVDYQPAESTTRDVRRQLELARARCGSRSTCCSSARCCSSTCYYGDDFTIECPTGSGDADDAVRGGRGDRATADRASSCATPTGAARSTAAREKFQDDPHWRDLHPVLRVLPRRQRRRPRRQPPDRLDRARRRASSSCSATTTADAVGRDRRATVPYRRLPTFARRPCRSPAAWRGKRAVIPRGSWPVNPVLHELGTWPWLRTSSPATGGP